MSIRKTDGWIDEGRVPVLVHVEFVDVTQVAFEVINPQKPCPTTINCVSRHRVRKIRKNGPLLVHRGEAAHPRLQA